jgi:hypothetical protein
VLSGVTVIMKVAYVRLCHSSMPFVRAYADRIVIRQDRLPLAGLPAHSSTTSKPAIACPGELPAERAGAEHLTAAPVPSAANIFQFNGN